MSDANQNSAQPVPAEQSNSAQTNERNRIAVLSYLGLLILVPLLLTDYKTDFVRFHNRQGLGIIVLELATFVLQIVRAFMPFFIRWPFSIAISLVNLGVLILAIIGIVNVVQNKTKPLPVADQIAKLLPESWS